MVSAIKRCPMSLGCISSKNKWGRPSARNASGKIHERCTARHCHRTHDRPIRRPWWISRPPIRSCRLGSITKPHRHPVRPWSDRTLPVPRVIGNGYTALSLGAWRFNSIHPTRPGSVFRSWNSVDDRSHCAPTRLRWTPYPYDAMPRRSQSAPHRRRCRSCCPTTGSRQSTSPGPRPNHVPHNRLRAWRRKYPWNGSVDEIGFHHRLQLAR